MPRHHHEREPLGASNPPDDRLRVVARLSDEEARPLAGWNRGRDVAESPSKSRGLSVAGYGHARLSLVPLIALHHLGQRQLQSGLKLKTVGDRGLSGMSPRSVYDMLERRP